MTQLNFAVPVATSTTVGGIKLGTGFTIAPDGTLSGGGGGPLTPATNSTLGGVIAGFGIAVDANGVITAGSAPQVANGTIPVAIDTQTFSFNGIVHPIVGNARWYPSAGSVVTKFYASIEYPATTDVTLSVSVNGTTVPNSTITIPAGQYKSDVVDLFTNMIPTDYLTVNILTGNDGANISAFVVSNYNAPSVSPLPVADTATMGLVKVGAGLTIDANGALSVASLVPQSGTTFADNHDFCAFVAGTPTNSQVIGMYVAPQSYILDGGGFGRCDIAPTMDCAFEFTINGATVGNIIFTAGSTSATVNASSQQINAGDVLRLVAPPTVDATISNVAISLGGSGAIALALPIATSTTLGMVKAGNNVAIGSDGSLSSLSVTGYYSTQSAAVGAIVSQPVGGLASGMGQHYPSPDPFLNNVPAYYLFNENNGAITFNNSASNAAPNYALSTSKNVFATGTGGEGDNLGIAEFGVSNASGFVEFISGNTNPTTHLPVTSIIGDTEDFCIEAFFYPKSRATKTFLMGTSVKEKSYAVLNNNATTAETDKYLVEYPLALYMNTDGSLTLEVSSYSTTPAATLFAGYPNKYFSSSVNQIANSVAMGGTSDIVPLNQWVHIALVRGVNAFKVFVNGVSVLTLNDYIGTPATKIGVSPVSYEGTQGLVAFYRGASVALGGRYIQSYPNLSSANTYTLAKPLLTKNDFYIGGRTDIKISAVQTYADDQANPSSTFAFFGNATPPSSNIETTGNVSASLPFTGYWYRLAYGNGKAVASIGSSTCAIAYSSNNGTSWAGVALPTYSTSNAYIAPYALSGFGNGNFVLSTDITSTNHFYTSSDAVTWTPHNYSSALPLDNFGTKTKFNVGAAGSKYIATLRRGYDTVTGYSNWFVSSSSDGDTWSAEVALTAGTKNYIDPATGLAYGNGVYVLVTTNSDNSLGVIPYFTSTDGVSWTSHSLASTNSVSSVEFINGNFVLMGHVDNSIFTSTDGINWTSKTSPNSVGVVGLVSVAWNGTHYIATGKDTNNVNNGRWAVSTDLNQWYAVTPPTGTLAPSVNSTYWGSQVVAIGSSFLVITGNNSNLCFYGDTASSVPTNDMHIHEGEIAIKIEAEFAFQNFSNGQVINYVGSTTSDTSSDGTWTIRNQYTGSTGVDGLSNRYLILTNKQALTDVTNLTALKATNATTWNYSYYSSASAAIIAETKPLVGYIADNLRFNVVDMTVVNTGAIAATSNTPTQVVLAITMTLDKPYVGGMGLRANYLVDIANLTALDYNYNSYVSISSNGLTATATIRANATFVDAVGTVLTDPTAQAKALMDSTPAVIGQGFVGYVDEFRITTGLPRYTYDFAALPAVPTAPVVNPTSGIGTGYPVSDSLASKVYGYFNFNDGAGNNTFASVATAPASSLSMTAYGVNAFCTADGGNKDNLGTVETGIGGSTGIVFVNNSTSTTSVIDGTADFCMEGFFYFKDYANDAFLMGTESPYSFWAMNSAAANAPEEIRLISVIKGNPLSLVMNGVDGSLTLSVAPLALNSTYSTDQNLYNNGMHIGAYQEYFEPTQVATVTSAADTIAVTHKWYHIALVRGLGKFTVYVNGTKACELADNVGNVKYNISPDSASSSNSSVMSYKSQVVLGGSITQAYPLAARASLVTPPATPSETWSKGFVGYIDDFRVTKSVPRYLAPFASLV